MADNKHRTPLHRDAPVTLNTPHGEAIEACYDLLFLRAAVNKLWRIIDDIDSASDMAKDNDKWYRARVGDLQSQRWRLGITTDGYGLYRAVSTEETET